MRFKAFLFVVILVLRFEGLSQEAELPSFREPLYFSDIDRENRSPQAVRVGGVVFVSAIKGQGDTLNQQAKTVYMRLQSILGNYGLTMADAAQERIYVKEGVRLEGLDQMRPLYYGENLGPATTLVSVSGFEDPGTLIAIELIAVANPDME